MNNKIVSNQNLSSLDEVTNTGTLFKNIYKPYKVVPKMIAESNEEKLLLKIQQYEIALMDLNLYLDVFPNDGSLINLYKQYEQEKENLIKEFEKDYYPISKQSAANDNKWNWLDGKWAWECEKNV